MTKEEAKLQRLKIATRIMQGFATDPNVQLRSNDSIKYLVRLCYKITDELIIQEDVDYENT